MARGIGAAIQGFFGGYSYGEDLKDRRRARERQDRLDSIAEEQRQIDNRIRSEQQDWARANHEWQQGLNQRQQAMWNAYAKAADIAANSAAARTHGAPATGGVRPDPTGKVLDIIANESGAPGRPQARPAQAPAAPLRPQARPARGAVPPAPAVAQSTVPTAPPVATPAPTGGRVMAAPTMATPDGWLPPTTSNESAAPAPRGVAPDRAAQPLPDAPMQNPRALPPSQGVVEPEDEARLRAWMEQQASPGRQPAAPSVTMTPAPQAIAVPPAQPVSPPEQVTAAPTRERPLVPDRTPQLLDLPSRQDQVPTRGMSRSFGSDTAKSGGKGGKGDEKQSSYGLPEGAPPLVPESPLERDGPTDAYGLRPTDPPLVPQSPLEQRVERERGETVEQEATAQVLENTGAPSAQALAEQVTGKDAPRSRAAAERAAEDFMTAYRRDGAPYLEEQLLRLGMIDEVAAFREWMASEATRAGMEAYGNAAFAAARGDMERFAEAIVDLYNNEDYFPDDLTVDRAGSRFVENEDGDIIGAEITFVDSEGNRFIETWEGMDDLVEDILNLTSPERAFELQIARSEAALQALSQADQHQRAQIEAMRERVMGIVESLTDPILGGDAAAAWQEASSDERIAMIVERLDEVDAAVMEALGFTVSEDEASAVLPDPYRFDLN